jgi:hypothetical protein
MHPREPRQRCRRYHGKSRYVCPDTGGELVKWSSSQVAFLDCRIGGHVPVHGWEIKGSKLGELRFEEFQSLDLKGKPLDISQRHRASKQLSSREAAALADPRKVLGGADDWDPTAPPGFGTKGDIETRDKGSHSPLGVRTTTTKGDTTHEQPQ